MPELPEVETVRRGLQVLLPGKVIKSVEYDWDKSFPNAKADADQFLINAKIKEVRRRAKVLMIDLDTDYSLVIHLKMTGQLVYVRKAHKLTADSSQLTAEEKFGGGHPSDSLVGMLPDRSTRVTFLLSDSAKLFFNDQRKFGWVRLMPTIEIPNIDFMMKVGPEPLSDDFTPKDFYGRLMMRKNSNIKAALLDQTVIAGVGNIYADESLWEAKIHPESLVKNISQAKLNTLFKALRQVMELSIEKGGSSDKNYVNAEGKKGSYLSFANVFRRENQPCPRHPDTMILKTRVAGRGTHICPKCQRPPANLAQ